MSPPFYVPPPPPERRFPLVLVLVPLVGVVAIVVAAIGFGLRAQRASEERAAEEQERALREANQAFAQAMSAAASAQSAAAAMNAPPPAPSGPKVYGLSELGTSEFRGWQPVDAPGSVGGTERFDPSSNVGWANDVARHWAADARLVQVEVDHAGKDGLVATTTVAGAKVTYRFQSPSRTAQWRKASGAVAPDVETELALEIAALGVRARKTTLEPPLGPTPSAVSLPCSLSAALASQPVRPSYDVTLVAQGWRTTDGTILACTR